MDAWLFLGTFVFSAILFGTIVFFNIVKAGRNDAQWVDQGDTFDQ